MSILRQDPTTKDWVIIATNQAKRHLRKYNGIPQHHFNLFLKECEWRFNTQSPQQMLKELNGWLKEESP